MNINLHIDQLILDGISIEPHQRAELKTAVESELNRLLIPNETRLTMQSSNKVQTGLITFNMHSRPFKLGQQIAQSVYGGITHE